MHTSIVFEHGSPPKFWENFLYLILCPQASQHQATHITIFNTEHISTATYLPGSQPPDNLSNQTPSKKFKIFIPKCSQSVPSPILLWTPTTASPQVTPHKPPTASPCHKTQHNTLTVSPLVKLQTPSKPSSPGLHHRPTTVSQPHFRQFPSVH